MYVLNYGVLCQLLRTCAAVFIENSYRRYDTVITELEPVAAKLYLVFRLLSCILCSFRYLCDLSLIFTKLFRNRREIQIYHTTAASTLKKHHLHYTAALYSGTVILKFRSRLIEISLCYDAAMSVSTPFFFDFMYLFMLQFCERERSNISFRRISHIILHCSCSFSIGNILISL